MGQMILRVEVNESEALAALSNIDKAAQELANKKFNLSIFGSNNGIAQAAKDFSQTASAAGQAATSLGQFNGVAKSVSVYAQDIETGVRTLTQSIDAYTRAIGKATEVTTRYAEDGITVASITEKVTNDFAKRTAAAEKAAAAQQKQLDQEAHWAAEEAKYWDEMAKAAEEAEYRKAQEIEKGTAAISEALAKQEQEMENFYAHGDPASDKYFDSVDKAAAAEEAAHDRIAKARQAQLDRENQYAAQEAKYWDDSARAAEEAEYRKVQEIEKGTSQILSAWEEEEKAMQAFYEHGDSEADEYFNRLEQDTQRAAEQAQSLAKGFADLDASMDRTSGKYDEGTFSQLAEGISTSRRLLDELNEGYANGEVSEEAYIRGVDLLSEALKRLQTDFSTIKADTDQMPTWYEGASKSVQSLSDKYQQLLFQIERYEASGKFKNGTFDAMKQSAQEAQSALGELNGQIQNHTVTEEQAASTTEQYANTFTNLQQQMRLAAQNSENLEQKQSKLGSSLKSVIARYVSLAAVINTTIRALREAFNTMRDVDQELANIQKVTGASASEIERIGDAAYSTASKYGVTANEYLQAAATFAKAGYDNYDSLAELAIKTQLVGDVSADVASQFLVSADAAWKFKGNVDELSTVLDAANTIENNFATSIDKIAEGFPVVASVASNANMSIQETIAAIGTITSVTQESGKRASTALRSLILNIQGEVGAVIDDDLTVTQESVESITDALKKYAPEVIEAAKATGKLVDPMEAIAALSKAVNDGTLNEIELAQILSGIGGKLRTNQLTALVKNWDDVYTKMLELTEGSAGSANDEVAIMLDTWNSKVNILKNTWTELVANIVDTRSIKGAIDDINGALDELIDHIRAANGKDDWIGYANTRFGGDGKLFKGDLITNDHTTGYTTSELQQYLQEYNSRTTSTGQSLISADGFWGWLERTYPKAADDATEATADLTEATLEYADAADEATESGEEQVEQLNELYDAINGAREATEEYKNALKAEEKDEIFRSYADAFKTLQEEIDAGRVNSNAFWASAEYLLGPEILEEYGYDAEKIAEHFADLEGIFGDADSAGKGLLETLSGMADEAGAVRDEAGNIIATISGNAEDGWTWWIEDNEAVAEKLGITEDALDALMSALGVFSNVAIAEDKKAEDATDDVTEALGEAADAANTLDSQNLDSFQGEVQSATSDVNNLTSALNGAANAASKFTLTSMGTHLSGKFASGTRNAPGGLTLVNEQGPELISDNGQAYIANGGRPAIVNLGKGAIVLTAEQTRSAIGSANMPMPINAAAVGTIVDPSKGTLYSNKKNVTPGTKDKNKTSGGSGGGSPSAAGDNSLKDAQDKLKDALDDLDEQIELAKNEGNTELVYKLYKQAQDIIGSAVDDFVSKGYARDSAEVAKLLNQKYDYSGDEKDYREEVENAPIEKLKDLLDDLDEQIELAENKGDHEKVLELYGKAQDLISDTVDEYLKKGYKANDPLVAGLLNKGYGYAEDQLDYRDDIEDELWENLLNAIDELTAATDEANDLETKRLAVEDARKAYENVQKQRTVRILNPTTGQWEWVANAESVEAAQKQLQEAEKTYQDKQLSQEIAAIKSGGDLNNLTVGPALTAFLGTKSEGDLQTFANALQALYGAPSYLGNTAANSAFTNNNADSHDTNYYFPGGITVSENDAQSMTLADLAQRLKVLDITA